MDRKTSMQIIVVILEYTQHDYLPNMTDTVTTIQRIVFLNQFLLFFWIWLFNNRLLNHNLLFNHFLINLISNVGYASCRDMGIL